MEGSIFEKFVILFTANTKEVEEGTDKAKTATKKLHEELGSIGGVAKKAGAHVTDFFKEAAGAFLAFLTLHSVVDQIKETAEFADRLGKLSQQLNINIEDLSAWGDAVKVSGGNTESFQETIKRLTASFSDFATKGHSRVAPFFQALKINMVDAHHHARSVLSVLPELADAFQKIGKQESFGIGEKMGLDEGTILMLQRGRKYVEDMLEEQKRLGVVTKELAEVSETYNDQIENTHHAFRTFYGILAIDILPILTEFYKLFENVAVYFSRHSHIIEGALLGIAIAISAYLIPAIISAIVAFSPFLAIGAAIAALIGIFALLYEDVKNFEEGNKSALGEILKRWPQVGVVLKGIGNIIRQMKESIELFGYVSVRIIQWVVDTITGAFHGILDIVGKVEQVLHRIKAAIGGESNINVKGVLDSAKQQMHLASISPITAQTSSSIMTNNRNSARSTTIQTGPITINTQATNPETISKALSDHLQTQLRHAVNNFDDGVAA